MAVPKRRKSHSKVRMRRAHWNLKAPQLGLCHNCGARILSHVVCPLCGFYRGRKVIEVKD